MEGLGQHNALFSSPDAPYGVATWDQMSGLQLDDPFVAGPGWGGNTPDLTQPGTTGLVHVATGGDTPPAATQSHWSNLLDWRNNPMPYLLALFLLFLGVVQFQISGGARLGRR